MRDNRGPWYLLTALLLGLAGGLIYARVIAPVRWVNASPASLSPEFKDQYRVLIASAFEADGDLERARARLLVLEYPSYAKLTAEERQAGIEESIRALTLQAQRALAENHPQAEIYAIGRLVLALDQGFVPPTPASAPLATLPTSTPPASEAPPSLTPTPVLIAWTNTPTAPPPASETPGPGTPSAIPPSPIPTRTSAPTITPTPTPGAPFALQSSDLVCDLNASTPQIQVETLDAANQPVAGVEIVVSWASGEDHFFTGLKPELGLGYADFEMAPETSYTLRINDGGQSVTTLAATSCPDGTWGIWKMVFIQP